LRKSYVSLGQIAYFNFDYPKAISLFSKALEIDLGARKQDLERSTVYFYRGYSNYKIGNYPNALDDYNQAIQQAPQDAKLFRYRGYVYYLNGNYKKSNADFQYSLALCNHQVESDDNDPEGFICRARSYVALIQRFLKRVIISCRRRLYLISMPKPYHTFRSFFKFGIADTGQSHLKWDGKVNFKQENLRDETNQSA